MIDSIIYSLFFVKKSGLSLKIRSKSLFNVFLWGLGWIIKTMLHRNLKLKGNLKFFSTVPIHAISNIPGLGTQS